MFPFESNKLLFEIFLSIGFSFRDIGLDLENETPCIKLNTSVVFIVATTMSFSLSVV